MKTQELDELIQRVLDGEGTDRDRPHLEAEMHANPEAQARFDELQALFRDLAHLHEFEPPPDLESVVACKVRELAQESDGAEQAFRPRRHDSQAHRLWGWLSPGHTVAFAMGSALCLVLVLAVGRYPQFDSDSIPGSMVLGRAVRSQAQVLGSQSLDFEGGQGVLRSFTENGAVFVEIELKSSRPVSLRLALDAKTMTLRGFDRPSRTRPAEVDASGVALRDASQGRYVFAIEAGPQAPKFVTVTLDSGTQIVRAEVPIVKPGI